MLTLTHSLDVVVTLSLKVPEMSSQEGCDDGAVAVSSFDCAIFDIQKIHRDVQSGAIKKARENTDFPATYFRTTNTREKAFTVLKVLGEVAVKNGEP